MSFNLTIFLRTDTDISPNTLQTSAVIAISKSWAKGLELGFPG